MKIRSKLILSTSSLLLMIVLIASSQLIAIRRMNTIYAKQQNADRIINSITGLNRLTFDYLIHPTERAFTQWTGIHRELKEEIIKMGSGTCDEQLMKKIQRNQNDIHVLFSIIVQKFAYQGMDEPLSQKELKDRLINQILVKTEDMISGAHQLSGLIRKELHETQKENSIIVFLTVSMISLFIFINFFFINNSITKPIYEIMRGTRHFGQGKLEYRIALRSGDEIGRLAEEFNRMADNLNRITVAKTNLLREIAERKKIEKTLTESNKELDDFAYIASHDLKEPLRGIMNYSSFLLEDYGEKLDEEGRSKLKTLVFLSQRLTSFIEDLLTFSRLGRTELAYKETDLNAVVKDLILFLNINGEQKNVNIQIPVPLPTIFCDSIRIRELFYNILSNSLKYNDKDEKYIEIGTQIPDREEEAALFYVRDNGIGIRENHIDKVFTIFKRLHSRDRYGGGTGAGLTIAKKIVEKHNGRIWLESVFGEGTCFYFTIGKYFDT